MLQTNTTVKCTESVNKYIEESCSTSLKVNADVGYKILKSAHK